MELIFNDKQTKFEIFNTAASAPPLHIDSNKSYIIHGDNFEAMAGILNCKSEFIDLIYIDPPFNTNQSFSFDKDRANAISKSKKGTVAYNDIMTNDEYLKFMYDRFVLMYDLLSEKGSIYVHIDTKMGHYVKLILDEIFGLKNYKNDITRIKSNPKNFDRRAFGNEKDMILFYSKNYQKNIWNDVRVELKENEIKDKFNKIDDQGRRYTTIPLHAPGETENGVTALEWRGMSPPNGRHWRTSPDEFERMDIAGDIEWSKTGNPRIKKYADEHKGKKIQDVWVYKDPQKPSYPTQKNSSMLEMIIEQSSNPDSIVMDCFAGSGTTLLAAAKLGRKFIGIDSSEASLNLIKNNMAKNKISFEEIHG